MSPGHALPRDPLAFCRGVQAPPDMGWRKLFGASTREQNFSARCGATALDERGDFGASSNVLDGVKTSSWKSWLRLHACISECAPSEDRLALSGNGGRAGPEERIAGSIPAASTFPANRVFGMGHLVVA